MTTDDTTQNIIENLPSSYIFLYLLFCVGIFVCYVVFMIKFGKRDRRMKDEFEKNSHRAEGKAVSVKGKRKFIKTGHTDSGGNQVYRTILYDEVVYENSVNGITYKYTGSFESSNPYPEKHDLLYNPKRPDKAYWSADNINSGKNTAMGCLGPLCFGIAWIIMTFIFFSFAGK